MHRFCGVGFGSGLGPKAPGTFGSTFALLFTPLWLYLGFLIWSVFAITIMSLIGIYICGHTAKVIDVHDDGRIVWDEFRTIDYAIALALCTAIKLVMGHCRFHFFRILDIWKPFPISWADQKCLVV